ncbi:Alcohol dehydrogenase, iron-type [Niveomyces insectorum RCEF 264]|uniref:Alcohol dehydrogenase, iron-type n=1 Tax=Niveomyces insectorum RCEF 264 TaxID=1081102 RepID=A0A167RDX9_9HYPO|nr:Alcohol dehydrogenase, iron-type [Niveomyces insectorum RCEF 264]
MSVLQDVDTTTPLPNGEVHGKLIQDPKLFSPTISYGLPFDQAIPRHVAADAKVFVLASPSLCKNTDALDRLKAALGDRIKGVQMGMAQHTLLEECVEVFRAMQAAQADTVITLGAGSLADAAKLICAMTANELDSVDALAKYEIVRHAEDMKLVFPALTPHKQNLIMVPTTLSGGEHTFIAGVTDGKTKRKYQVAAGGSTVTILDPWLCLSTPSRIWLETGVRGIDHGVEIGVGRGSRDEVIETSLRGLRFLIPGLLAARQDKEGTNVQARLRAQLGVALTITPFMWGDCYPGASHGIGHMLGPMGVKHGETSCVLLPAVCRYNKSANGDKQAAIASGLWNEPTCAELFASKGLTPDEADLADLLHHIISELGMPRNLQEVGVEGDEKLQRLAENSLHDFSVKLNPRPIHKPEHVMEILRAVEK